jgi:hypothetical protein
MNIALLIGTSVGAVIGLLHAWQVYRKQVGEFPNAVVERPIATRGYAAYSALWTLFLWTVFGSYVFFLWAISVIVYSIYKGIRLFSAG